MVTINHNEYNFIPGDRAIVDEGYRNSCEVTIQSFTPNKMFVKIKADDGYEWSTMTSRLTPIKK